MTRLAILEPDPRICGAVTWALHVREGARQLGFDVEIVTPTKSGKPSTRWGANPVGRPDMGAGWTPWPPDATPKHADAHAYLAEFDFIILPEPKSAHPDKEALKKKQLPQYVYWLRDSGKPFLTALMGPQYDAKQWHADFVGEVLALPNFVPIIATSANRFRSTNEALMSDRLTFVKHPLPYAPKFAVDQPLSERQGVVGFTGRMMPNLGPQLLAAAAREIHAPSIELWGSASVGLGANATYILWKHMIEGGWTGERLAHKLKCSQCKKDYDGARIPPGGITCECGYVLNGEIRPSPWWVQKDGKQVAYFGAFPDDGDVCRRFDVHVDLTARTYSHSLVKYTSLEAIDAGCIPVLPTHLNTDEYATFPVDLGQKGDPKSITMIERDKANEQLSAVTQACNAALELSDADRAQAIAYNRWNLRDKNDPASFLRTWLAAWS